MMVLAKKGVAILNPAGLPSPDKTRRKRPMSAKCDVFFYMYAVVSVRQVCFGQTGVTKESTW